ncbi:MAG: acylphosphatase [Candidatus Bilamarchaeaceae archaeon]
MTSRFRITVYGRVQRVGYRDAVAEIARKLNLKGSVKNLEDEVSVEIIAEGEEKQLDEFLKLIHIKRYPIEVEKIDVHKEKPTGEFRYFKIVRGEPDEEIGERLDVAGTLLYKSLEKQDKTLEKLDGLLEKQDKLLEKQDKLLEKQDKLLEKQDKLLEKQDKLLEKQDELLEKQDKSLEKLDQSLEKLDQSLEKQDKSLEKQDGIIQEIKSMKTEMVTRFDLMEKKYGKISEALERISVALEVLAGLKPK